MEKSRARKIIQIFPRLGDGEVKACFYGLASDGSVWLLARLADDKLEWREILGGKLLPAGAK